MDVPQSHYEVLGVEPESGADVIRGAYRKLARRFHPDIAGGSPERMVLINAAWDVLCDPAKRAAYDRQRCAQASRPAAFGPGPITRRRMHRAPIRPAIVLDFGRYQGWTLSDLARQDPAYLEWFSRTPAGRLHSAQIHELLDVSGRPGRR
jgi:curved DNA-binding protein CbpA